MRRIISIILCISMVSLSVISNFAMPSANDAVILENDTFELQETDITTDEKRVVTEEDGKYDQVHVDDSNSVEGVKEKVIQEIPDDLEIKETEDEKKEALESIEETETINETKGDDVLINETDSELLGIEPVHDLDVDKYFLTKYWKQSLYNLASRSDIMISNFVVSHKRPEFKSGTPNWEGMIDSNGLEVTLLKNSDIKASGIKDVSVLPNIDNINERYTIYIYAPKEDLDIHYYFDEESDIEEFFNLDEYENINIDNMILCDFSEVHFDYAMEKYSEIGLRNSIFDDLKCNELRVRLDGFSRYASSYNTFSNPHGIEIDVTAYEDSDDVMDADNSIFKNWISESHYNQQNNNYDTSTLTLSGEINSLDYLFKDCKFESISLQNLTIKNYSAKEAFKNCNTLRRLNYDKNIIPTGTIIDSTDATIGCAVVDDKVSWDALHNVYLLLHIDTNYGIYYHLNGGSWIDNVEPNPSNFQKDEGKIVLPTKNSIAQFEKVFDGWYTDEELTEKIIEINKETDLLCLHLYAKWEDIPYDIFYDLNGVEANLAKKGIDKTDDIKLLTPTNFKDGYIFTGWYKDAACTQIFDINKDFDNNEIDRIYAGWKVRVIYDTLPGCLVASPIYVAKGTSITLTAPPKRPTTGEKFVGWFLNKDNNDVYSNKVTGNLTINSPITIYGQWKKMIFRGVYYFDNSWPDLLSVPKKSDRNYYIYNFQVVHEWLPIFDKTGMIHDEPGEITSSVYDIPNSNGLKLIDVAVGGYDGRHDIYIYAGVKNFAIEYQPNTDHWNQLRFFKDLKFVPQNICDLTEIDFTSCLEKYYTVEDPWVSKAFLFKYKNLDQPNLLKLTINDFSKYYVGDFLNIFGNYDDPKLTFFYGNIHININDCDTTIRRETPQFRKTNMTGRLTLSGTINSLDYLFKNIGSHGNPTFFSDQQVVKLSDLTVRYSSAKEMFKDSIIYDFDYENVIFENGIENIDTLGALLNTSNVPSWTTYDVNRKIREFLMGETYGVSYDLKGGSWKGGIQPDLKLQRPIDGASDHNLRKALILLPTEDDVVKDGYTFDGWYSDEEFTNQVDNLLIYSDKITLYAKWNAKPVVPSGVTVPKEIENEQKEPAIPNNNNNNESTNTESTNTESAKNVSGNVSGKVVSRNGVGSSGGSGNGGSGGGMNSGVNTKVSMSSFESSTTISALSKSTSTKSIASNLTNWMYDPYTNKFKLTINASGQNSFATNGFFTLNTATVTKINNLPMSVAIQDTYYFDKDGNMVTGWVKTIDNKTYFFENAKTVDEGKMAVGWKIIQNKWYYFNQDGSMQVNGTTPDGYKINADGTWMMS